MQAQTRPQTSVRRAFTLLELVVVLATVAVLGAVLLPALAASKSGSPRVQCMNNLKQVAMGTLLYVADNNGVFPTMKWRSSNPTYSYEMMRFATINSTNPVYDTAGGPYNFGLLWSTKVLTNGRVFYCPGERGESRFNYDYYAAVLPWPYGINASGAANPGYVRAGYTYMPQLTVTTNLYTSLGVKTGPDLPARASAQPEFSWIALLPIRQTSVDLKHSFASDLVSGTLTDVPHRDLNNLLEGMNAAFPDGHVVWQGTNRVSEVYNVTLWSGVANGVGEDLRYIESLFQP